VLGLARWPGKAAQALTLADAAYRTGSHVVEARGTTQLESVRLSQGGRMREVACERLACGFGLVPNTQLGQMLGCALAPFGDSGTLALAVDERQATSLDGVYAAGEWKGIGRRGDWL
ncbi:FAD-dependent oxidoreductase, partial [Variovorax sp. CT11-76]